MLVGGIGAELPSAIGVADLRFRPAGIQFDTNSLPLAKRLLKA